MIRVLQFADLVNRHDFIESIVRWASPSEFEMSVCVRSKEWNIAAPVYRPQTAVHVLNGAGRQEIPMAASQLAALVRRGKIDIVHAHHFDQGVIAWMATRLCRSTALVIGRHYSDALYRIPSRTKRNILLAIERTVNRAAARIIVPSAFIYRLLSEEQEVDSNKIDVIPYGFEPEKYVQPSPVDVGNIKQELHLSPHDVVFGTFGRLHEEKGHRYLLQAFAALKQKETRAVLVVVGDGPERAAIEKQVDHLRLRGSIRILGWRRDAVTLMAAVDVVVQPTLQEAFSQVMAEAMWMGKALIITDVSGAADVICNGINGIIVPRASSEALTVQMVKLAADADLRSKVGQAGREYVESNLLIEKIIRGYEDSYRRAMQEREPASFRVKG